MASDKVLAGATRVMWVRGRSVSDISVTVHKACRGGVGGCLGGARGKARLLALKGATPALALWSKWLFHMPALGESAAPKVFGGRPYLFSWPPAARLSTWTIRAAAPCGVRGLGATGDTYQIEPAAKLINRVWTPLGAATADGNGRFTFLTSQPANTPARFYRAVSP